MPSYPDKPRRRSPFDTQVHFVTGLAEAGIDTMRRLSELNLQLARQFNDDAMNATRALLAFAARAAGAAHSPPPSHQPE